MELRIDLLGKCGIYCGACRLYVLEKCEGCLLGHKNCLCYKSAVDKGYETCGECPEFPCEIHYGPCAMYAKEFLDFKKRKIGIDHDCPEGTRGAVSFGF